MAATTTTKERPKKGQVNVRHYQSLESPQDMREWPNAAKNDDFLGMLAAEGVAVEEATRRRGKEAAPLFWQAAIRWALLKKYGRLGPALEDPYCVDPDTSQRSLQFSDRDIQTIAEIWKEQCSLAKAVSSSSTKDDEDDDDLRQFLRAGGLSNNRKMQWSFLDCGPACQFQLHAHPNLEVIYCVRGSLHEIRCDGPPVTKAFDKEAWPDSNSNDNNDANNNNNGNAANSKLMGPDLSYLKRPWNFGTLLPKHFLVNEVGSIHKSFSATNGNGCQLLVLWGGSHADVGKNMEPTLVNVQGALEAMDQRLSCECGSAAGGAISETFLPASERC